MRSSGRLLMMGASSGPINMGVDEALATLCRDVPVLRLYAWEASTVSLGCVQRGADIDPAACRRSAVAVVRRPTGGRAVLHNRDVAYSLILPLRPPWTTMSITESYRRINACLRRGLEMLGLKASMASRPEPLDGALASFCFPAIAQYEVLVGGKKVIGSAQRRFPSALLQQGSIVSDVDRAAMLALLPQPERAAAADRVDMIGSIRDALGWLPDCREIGTAIRDGFAAEMDIEFVEGRLRPEECRLSAEFAIGRYSASNWTFRR